MHETMDGRHGSYSLAYREVVIERPIAPALNGATRLANVGQVAVEICTACLYTTTTCLHRVTDWNESGTVLTCALCGLDLT